MQHEVGFVCGIVPKTLASADAWSLLDIYKAPVAFETSPSFQLQNNQQSDYNLHKNAAVLLCLDNHHGSNIGTFSQWITAKFCAAPASLLSFCRIPKPTLPRGSSGHASHVKSSAVVQCDKSSWMTFLRRCWNETRWFSKVDSFTADVAHPKGDIDQDARYQVLLIIPHRFSAFNVAEVRPAPLLLLLPKRGSLLT